MKFSQVMERLTERPFRNFFPIMDANTTNSTMYVFKVKLTRYVPLETAAIFCSSEPLSKQGIG